MVEGLHSIHGLPHKFRPVVSHKIEIASVFLRYLKLSLDQGCNLIVLQRSGGRGYHFAQISSTKTNEEGLVLFREKFWRGRISGKILGCIVSQN